jgi:glycosyltransferase involved in cell wall biosynthesis
MEISLCLLTWNEIHGCRQSIPNLPNHLFQEVFALDGGSTDGTIEYLTEHGIDVVSQRNGSYNAAYIEAIDHYKGDAIVFYHPKGTVDEASLSLIVEKLRRGCDFVVASRMLPGATNEEDSQLIRHRKWFGLGLSRAASLRWNRKGMERITDPLHGYRGCSRSFTDSLILLPTGVTADLEMVRHAYATGARCCEVPVVESEREIGVSHFPAFRTGRALIGFLLRQR